MGAARKGTIHEPYMKFCKNNEPAQLVIGHEKLQQREFGHLWTCPECSNDNPPDEL